MARKRSRQRSILLDIFDSLTELGLKLGALVFVVVLGYLVYGLVTKHGLAKIMLLPPEDRDRVLANVALSCKVLGITGTIVAVCAALRFYVEETLGYMMSLLGVLLYFGAPWAFSIWYSRTDLAANPAIAMIVGEIRLLGGVLFLPGVALIIYDISYRISRAIIEKPKVDRSFLVGKDAERVVEKAYRPRMYAKCWQMPYCRDFVRKVCPAYDRRKSCWRLRSGCYCDEKTMLRALDAQSPEGRKFAREVAYRTGGLPRKTALTAAQKRQICRNCVIYEFHQMQKYKLISPLVFPVVAVTVWMLYPTLERTFRAVVGFTDQFMKTVSFLPQAQDRVSDIPGISGVPEFVLVLFAAWLGIVALSYGLRLVEYCVFKLQI